LSEPLLAGQTGTAGSDIVDVVEITEAALPQAEAIGAPARSDDDMLAPMLATPAHAWASLDTQIAAGGVVKQEAVEPNPEMAQLAKISQRMCRARAALDKKRREKAGLGLPVDSSALLALPLVLPRLPSPAAAAAPAAAAPVLIPPFKTALEVAPVERAPATDEGELTAATLEQMGFEAAAVAAAMQQNGGDATRALERLLAVDEAEQSQAAATRARVQMRPRRRRRPWGPRRRWACRIRSPVARHRARKAPRMAVRASTLWSRASSNGWVSVVACSSSSIAHARCSTFRSAGGRCSSAPCDAGRIGLP